MTERKKNHKIIRLMVVILLFTLTFTACNSADDYYEALKSYPEIRKNYETVYSVGDTLVLQGRLAGNGLEIKVGNAEASVLGMKEISSGSRNSNDSLQEVSFIITDSMGIGTNRPVTLSLNGHTITCPEIEIVGSSKKGILSLPLGLEKVATFPAYSTSVYCHSGNGNLYFLNNRTFSVSRMTPDGTLETVFDTTEVRDADGTKFKITYVYGAGIDPMEKYLYLSLYTEPAYGTSYYNYFRLCRYDLRTKKFEVLNKTAYYIWSSGRTIEAIKPFEGPIGQVKMFGATGIYPAADGKVYFNMDGRFLTRLDDSGNYTYIFRSLTGLNYEPVGGEIVPEILKPGTERYYTEEEALSFFPGVQRSESELYALDPETDEAYYYSFSPWNPALYRYDLLQKAVLDDFSSSFNSLKSTPAYLNASFRSMNATIGSSAGFYPVGKGKLLVLFYQNTLFYNDYKGISYKEKFGIPAWAEMDFIAGRSQRYHPDSFDSGNFTIEERSQVINDDGNGMLYMKAVDPSSDTVVVRTVLKNKE